MYGIKREPAIREHSQIVGGGLIPRVDCHRFVQLFRALAKSHDKLGRVHPSWSAAATILSPILPPELPSTDVSQCA